MPVSSHSKWTQTDPGSVLSHPGCSVRARQDRRSEADRLGRSMQMARTREKEEEEAASHEKRGLQILG